jgi:hypothetical protein
MESQSEESKLKTHSGYYQISKEYPDIYNDFIVSRAKLLRDCPNDWKPTCNIRYERLQAVSEDFHPDKVKQEIFEKCEGYSRGPRNYAKCSSALYSTKSNKLMAESAKIKALLNNLNKYA